MVNEKPHRLVEVEFYFMAPKHQDVFSHQHKDQKQCAKWYFHKAGEGDNYKGGTYKGLDIAFGNPKAFGGILIRTIQDLTTENFIEGPCMCVDHILKMNGSATILDLVKTFDKSAEKKKLEVLYIWHLLPN